MAIKHGTLDVGKAYLGSTQLSEMYLGTVALFPDIRGEAVFEGVGNTTFEVPAGVDSVSIVCVGNGGPANSRAGGGGGGLAYANNVAVTPGETLDIQATARQGFSGQGVFADPAYVKRGAVSLCEAGGGQHSFSSQNTGGAGGTIIVGDGGGTGGKGGNGASGNSGAGGGAAGYSGNGGAGAAAGTGGSGTGGGGGGGGATGSSTSSGGGGVGVLSGEGASGAGGTSNSDPGKGGSGGNDGNVNSSQLGGGGGNNGGGSAGNDGNNSGQRFGGSGAVRIVWGDGRAFPSTDVGPT